MQAVTDADHLSQCGHWPAAKIRAHRAAAIMFLDHAIDNSRSWFEYRPAYTTLALAATLTPTAWAGDESSEHCEAD
jgi:hypothetical protein